SLTSAMLFNSGSTKRLTKVDKGNTITDFDPDEIERKISINSSVCYLEQKNHKINVIDCPGYSNFLWDTRACLRAVDAGVVTVCGVAGVEVGTEKVWGMLNDFGLPRLIVINKLDRENANFEKTLDSIHDFFGREAVPVQLPIGSENDFSGVVDLIEKKAFLFETNESGNFKEQEIPSDMKDEAEKRIKELTEMVAENDEQLMEKYFEQGDLSSEDLIQGLKKTILKGQFFPVLISSALFNIGIQPLMGKIIGFLPSPEERKDIKAEVNGKEETIKTSTDSPLSALVFKTISDPYTGRISIMRIFSGKISPDSTVSNTNKGTDEKLGGLFYLMGKEQMPAGQAKAGDIVATAKLKETSTGDTLCAKGAGIQFKEIEFP
ncbi:MAG: GTP-binding protein, partial [Candidatus Aminicenantaceae bacterium]